MKITYFPCIKHFKIKSNNFKDFNSRQEKGFARVKIKKIDFSNLINQKKHSVYIF